MLDAVLLAEAKDHANWSCVAGVVDDLPADNVRDAFQATVDEVEVQGNEHLRWTQDMRCHMVSLEPTSGPTSSSAFEGRSSDRPRQGQAFGSAELVAGGSSLMPVDGA